MLDLRLAFVGSKIEKTPIEIPRWESAVDLYAAKCALKAQTLSLEGIGRTQQNDKLIKRAAIQDAKEQWATLDDAVKKEYIEIEIGTVLSAE